MTDDLPPLPPDIERQYTDWLTGVHRDLGHTMPKDVRDHFDRLKAAAPPREDAFEKFARMAQRPDTPVQQPGWVDSRPQQKGPRYG
jgi:hypothetical protein